MVTGPMVPQEHLAQLLSLLCFPGKWHLGMAWSGTCLHLASSSTA